MSEINCDDDMVWKLIEGARSHGEESEPDHEVGDLQAFLLACWAVLTPELRSLVLDDPRVRNVIDGSEYQDR